MYMLPQNHSLPSMPVLQISIGKKIPWKIHVKWHTGLADILYNPLVLLLRR